MNLNLYIFEQKGLGECSYYRVLIVASSRNEADRLLANHDSESQFECTGSQPIGPGVIWTECY